MSTPPRARPQRADHTLAALGYGSRREAAALVAEGRVALADGTLVRDPALRADPKMLRLDGEPLDHPGPLVLLMNKAAGTVCSWNPSEGESVFDALPARWRRRNPQINTAGRLDRDTTGALVLTDDGALLHRLASPKAGFEKVYLATLDAPPPPETAALFASGALLLPGEAKPCLPAALSAAEPGPGGEPRARLVLREGKFHQVKRMFEAAGCRVLALHRERFGPWTADGLAPGSWREIAPEELAGAGA